MASKLHFNLVAPERQLMSADVDIVEAPGIEGAFGVLPGHAPMMTVLAAGVVKVKTGTDEKRIFVRGGFAEVTPEGLTILAEEAIFVGDLNAAAIAERIRNAEEDLADADTVPETRLRAQQELTQLREFQAAL